MGFNSGFKGLSDMGVWRYSLIPALSHHLMVVMIISTPSLLYATERAPCVYIIGG